MEIEKVIDTRRGMSAAHQPNRKVDLRLATWWKMDNATSTSFKHLGLNFLSTDWRLSFVRRHIFVAAAALMLTIPSCPGRVLFGVLCCVIVVSVINYRLSVSVLAREIHPSRR